MTNVHEDGATKMLAAIESGGHLLLMLTRRKIGSVLDDLDKGDFRAASGHLQEALSSVSPLANAQVYVAIAEGAKLVQARELEAGMVLKNVGEITNIEVTECGADRCGGHVKLMIGERHEAEYSGDTELYVDVGGA